MAQVEIYTTRYCPYCHSAKALLNRKGVAFVEIDVSGDPQGRARMVERANGRMTVPQIFIGAIHVGGFDELSALNRRGARYVGQVFVLDEAIVNGRGKVRVGDTVWPVAGPELAKGARVRVIGVAGTVLEVTAEG